MTDDLRQMVEMAVTNARRSTRRTVAPARKAWQLRGAALDIQTLTDAELLVSGPAGTGKSLGALYKIHTLMLKYPGARALFVRKVRADLAKSALVTFERHILGEDNPICSRIRREYRQTYRYPNGSEINMGGMDRPTAVMSAEYDIIYVQEAVELTETDWESLLTRLRNYVIPYQQLIADTNPDRPDHWLMQRAETGALTLLYSYHQDNPAYWDGQDWTEAGRDYVLGKLARLTGVRKARLLEGRWVVAEGAIYEEYRDDVHVVTGLEIPAHWTRFMSVDFGFTNPFVAQWWAVDGDGRADAGVSDRVVAALGAGGRGGVYELA